MSRIAPVNSEAARPRKKLRVRYWLRSLHRDAGYLAVGLTLVYAASGLAVNHIKDWDPSFRQFQKTHQLAAKVVLGPAPAEVAPDAPSADAPQNAATSSADRAAATQVLAELGIDEAPSDGYRATPTQLELVLEHSTLHVDAAQGVAIEEGQKPRFLLRIANWLHLNRGKKAWTYIADGYAAFLLYLAISGIFMLPGKGRFIGRRGLLISLGAALPVAYVVLSGGP